MTTFEITTNNIKFAEFIGLQMYGDFEYIHNRTIYTEI